MALRRRSAGRSAVAAFLLGSSLIALGPSSAAPADNPARALASVGESGAYVVRTDGTFRAYGDAPELAPQADPSPVVDVEVAPGGAPAVLRRDGGVVQVGGLTVTCPRVSPWWDAAALALTADGTGAWVAAVNGRVVNCGTAPDLAPADPAYVAPVVAAAATPSGRGLVLVTAAGEVEALGDARVHGRGTPGSSRFVGIAATAGGYWLARADGEVQAFGDAPALGGAPGETVVDLATTPSRAGYRLLTADGKVHTFGTLPVLATGQPMAQTIVDDGFEDGADGWTSWWGDPQPVGSDDARSGTGALALPGHWSSFANATRTVEALVGGRTYRLSYWVKGAAAVGGEFNWSSRDWSSITPGVLPAVASTADGWTPVTVELQAPSGVERLWLGLYANADVVLDDVSLVGPVPGGGAPVATTLPSSPPSSPPSSAGTAPTTVPSATTATTRPPAPTTVVPGPTTTRPATPTTVPGPTTTRPATPTTVAPTTAAPTPTTVRPGPIVTTLPPSPPPGPRVGRAPTSPDEIDARICGSARLNGGPISVEAARALYPGRTVVAVPAGDNSGAFSGASGTVYWFAPGTHTLGSSPFGQIAPRNDDVFIGAPGAVLDGRGINRYAFVGQAARVAIRYLTVTGFQSPKNEGVVNHDSGDDWLIEFTTIRANGGGGMMAGSGQVVRYSCLADNGQYGFNAYQGGDGIRNVVFEHNEIARNNTEDWEAREPGCGCTGGGKFWSVNGAIVRNNWVYDNKSVGLWADTNNNDFLFERNIVDRNESVGIWYEISYNARIVDNLLTRNGWVSGRRDQGAPAPAIYLSESGGDPRLPSSTAGSPTIEITGNVLVDNFSGITLYENANRFCNSNGNSSTGYCTPFVTGGVIPAPRQYGYGRPINENHACTAPGIFSEPLFTDCRWRTQRVAIHHNSFSFDPANVPCAGRFCGAMSLYGSGTDNQSWAPYLVADVLRNITTGQDNRWSTNAYRGPWRFATVYGDLVDLATWRSTYGQDAGSTFA